jgi:hypothetical protein
MKTRLGAVSHEPWMGRPVMWGTWAGVRHVVTNTAVIGA